MSKTKYILSVDGAGGMRGLIPAMILVEIEKRTNKEIKDIFDLMAGSSTGRLVVAALSKSEHPRLSAKHIVELFKQNGPRIFGSRLTVHKGPKYSAKYLERLLDKYFGESTFCHNHSGLLITSYDVYNNEPFIMNNWNDERRAIKIKDALRATMAVPTLFLPKDLQIITEDGTKQKRRVLVDGSMLANNPAGYAYGTAHKLWPDHKYILLSLGIGRSDMYINNFKAKTFTKGAWISPLRQIITSSSHEINYLLSGIMKSDFIRIEGSESTRNSEIDDASKKNLRALEREGTDIIDEHKEIIDKFCSLVS